MTTSPSFDATNELVFILKTTSPVTGDPVDPADLAFVTKFNFNNGNSPLTSQDVYGQSSRLFKDAAGSYRMVFGTETMVLGGQLLWTWYAQGGAQGSISGIVTINPPLAADPLL